MYLGVIPYLVVMMKDHERAGATRLNACTLKLYETIFNGVEYLYPLEKVECVRTPHEYLAVNNALYSIAPAVVYHTMLTILLSPMELYETQPILTVFNAKTRAQGRESHPVIQFICPTRLLQSPPPPGT